MSDIKKEKEELIQKYKYLKRKIENYNELVHRNECPYCEQKIDYKTYESQIPELELKLQEIKKRLDDIVTIILKIDREETLNREKKYREHRQEINEYIKKNRSKLNKAIRDYYKGIEKYLPDISNEEKTIWNEAMEWHLDHRNMDENDELLFEIN